MMSAPASRYCRWISRIASGWVIAKHVDEILQIARVVGELAAAEIGSPELQGMDHRAHRPVEDQNPPGEEVVERMADYGRVGGHGARS